MENIEMALRLGADFTPVGFRSGQFIVVNSVGVTSHFPKIWGNSPRFGSTAPRMLLHQTSHPLSVCQRRVWPYKETRGRPPDKEDDEDGTTRYPKMKLQLVLVVISALGLQNTQGQSLEELQQLQELFEQAVGNQGGGTTGGQTPGQGSVTPGAGGQFPGQGGGFPGQGGGFPGQGGFPGGFPGQGGGFPGQGGFPGGFPGQGGGFPGQGGFPGGFPGQGYGNSVCPSGSARQCGQEALEEEDREGDRELDGEISEGRYGEKRFGGGG
ncbi:heterogeneous nuclear ribonucleoproteins A2/B1-like [Macrobrachium nipponense]|uniref:heterogeneous nuclear ribonucleoproteins A2/B1-like n=1 Tax=Macrobrachium nipponense TaxID=159736 RepID=UPI0030C8B101